MGSEVVGGEESCRTEPLAYGFCGSLCRDSVRFELSFRRLSWCQGISGWCGKPSPSHAEIGSRIFTPRHGLRTCYLLLRMFSPPPDVCITHILTSFKSLLVSPSWWGCSWPLSLKPQTTLSHTYPLALPILLPCIFFPTELITSYGDV